MAEQPANPTPAAAPAAGSPPPEAAPGAAAAAPPETPKPDAESLAKLEQQTKRQAFEAMQRAKEFKRQKAELEAERAALAKDKEEAAAYRAEREGLRRNPARFLKSQFGETWKDTLAKVSMEEAATPELLAAEVEETRESFRKELDERDKKLREELNAKDQERLTQEHLRVRQEIEGGAVAYLKANPEKYPMVHAAGLVENIAAVIRNHFLQTSSENDEGETVPGELLTPEQAAAKMEADLEKFFTRVQAARKPAADAATAAKPSTVAPDAAKPASPFTQRRTLSTTMTGRSGPNEVPPKDDAERRSRALAAMDKALAARTQH